jgi:hypothetical protein
VSKLDEIDARLRACPGDWSVEEHGDGFALYSGRRGPCPDAETLAALSAARHGLNLIHLSDPAYQWPRVRPVIDTAHQDMTWLVAELRRHVPALCYLALSRAELEVHADNQALREHRAVQERDAARGALRKACDRLERAELRLNDEFGDLSDEEHMATVNSVDALRKEGGLE